jgi:hypothetical protein
VSVTGDHVVRAGSVVVIVAVIALFCAPWRPSIYDDDDPCHCDDDAGMGGTDTLGCCAPAAGGGLDDAAEEEGR